MSIIVHIYSTTMSGAIKKKCLSILLKVLHFSSAQMLTNTLRNLPFSSFLSDLLTNNESDMNLVITALTFAQILIEKLPDIFRIYFRKEGVFHAIQRLEKYYKEITDVDELEEREKKNERMD